MLFLRMHTFPEYFQHFLVMKYLTAVQVAVLDQTNYECVWFALAIHVWPRPVFSLIHSMVIPAPKGMGVCVRACV